MTYGEFGWDPPDDGPDDDYYDEEYGCTECDAYGEIQCSRHGAAMLDDLRRQDAAHRRLLDRAARAGVELDFDEADAALEQCARGWDPLDGRKRCEHGRPGRIGMGPYFCPACRAEAEWIPF